MNKLNPEKLHVEFRKGTEPTEPVLGRKYTLTHSDITADLYLTIGLEYAYDKINKTRDEVLAEWTMFPSGRVLYVYLYIDGEYNPTVTAMRDAIFRRELPLALESIRYGDRLFFSAHPELDNAQIWVRFDSSSTVYNKIEYWGTPQDYK